MIYFVASFKDENRENEWNNPCEKYYIKGNAENCRHREAFEK